MSTGTCFICDKHALGDAAEGGVLYEDDLIYVGHIHTMGETTAYRGWLVAETKRHVAGLGDLTDDEARALGSITNRVARILKDVADAEHVYSFVLGDGVPHLHVHIAPRYPNTPREFWGTRLREWNDAPSVDIAGMRRLTQQLQQTLLS